MSGVEIQEYVELADYNTMGVKAQARFFVEVSSETELEEILTNPRFQSQSKMVIGGGSNILFLHDFEGLVIYNQIMGKEILSETEEEVLLKVGSGENWHQLVMYCVEQGWGGIENLSLIPGLAGAAPIQNIGAYGVELEEVFVKLDTLMIQTTELRTFRKEDCDFGYRNSIFKNELKGKTIVTSITIRLKKKPDVNLSYKGLKEKITEKGIEFPTIRDVSEAVIEIRQSKLPDPAEIGNTGSFFKNPVISQNKFQLLKEKHPGIPSYPVGDKKKVPAAWLIDQCGWKGKRFGDAGVHEMQALVMVNYGNASGEQIWNLAQKIQLSVKQKFGVELVPEVNVI
ncbi:MAG: UDP-N-acetylmuramate dehydrogenase [Balneolaceae bacterium]|nr:UDP-N-acetylmuramate dehydrogenase [Balneolaceae bacterium]